MKDPNYWKKYVSETNIGEIERNIKQTTFKSRGLNLNLKYLAKDNNAPNILCITGTGGYSLTGAELGHHLHQRGYNVFGLDFQGHGDSEGERGDFTIDELVINCIDATDYISGNFNDRVGVIGTSLGGLVTFYLGLAQGPIKSIVCQNPGILTERKFQVEVFDKVTKKVKKLLPVGKLLVKLLPKVKIPTTLYIDFKGLAPTEKEKQYLIEKYLKDPNVVKWYTLRAVMSQTSTPPPNPIEEQKTPIMFLVPTRDSMMTISYVKDLYNRLPPIKKKILEVAGGHCWIAAYPRQAAKIICDWFDETL